MGLFERKNKELKLPAVLTQQEDPVNYNSVLDYLVGLSDKEYRQMTQSADVYRKANKEVAKIVGVKDEPTTTIKSDKPSDDEIDQAIDDTLAGNFIEDGPEAPKPVKKQAAKPKKIEIAD